MFEFAARSVLAVTRLATRQLAFAGSVAPARWRALVLDGRAGLRRRHALVFGVPFDVLAQRLDDLRIELRAGVLAQLGQRGPSRARRVVGALGDQRVKGVARSDDARSERYLSAGQAVGIAAAVPSLVAGANQARNRSQRRCGVEDPLADDRVLAHQAPLAVGQRARLVEHLVGNGELAQIVKLGSAAKLVELFGVQLELATDSRCQQPHVTY